LAPKAPGTFGSLAAIPPAILIHYYIGNLGLVIAAIIVAIIGTVSCHYYLKATGGEDPKEVVIDEVAGMWLTLAIMPLTFKGYLLGFILFRFFDIIKPWPVSYADLRVPGAFGVMLDDILAGLYPVFILAVIMIICNLLGIDFDVLNYDNYL